VRALSEKWPAHPPSGSRFHRRPRDRRDRGARGSAVSSADTADAIARRLIEDWLEGHIVIGREH